jgi:hypothetical protein
MKPEVDPERPGKSTVIDRRTGGVHPELDGKTDRAIADRM